MQDTGLPSFAEVTGRLFCIVLSVGVILYARGVAGRAGPEHIPLAVLPLLALLVIVILLCLAWLVRWMFPGWLRVGRSGTVLKEVMEIEGRV